MIIATSFVQSDKCRTVEFTTDDDDRPLVVQFAANTATDLRRAAAMVAPYCDGVDVNCGCPQRWARDEGLGACLIEQPELVADMVQQTRNALGDRRRTLSIKVRLRASVERTVELCRQVGVLQSQLVSQHRRNRPAFPTSRSTRARPHSGRPTPSTWPPYASCATVCTFRSCTTAT